MRLYIAINVWPSFLATFCPSSVAVVKRFTTGSFFTSSSFPHSNLRKGIMKLCIFFCWLLPTFSLGSSLPRYPRQNGTEPASPCAQVSMSSVAAMASDAICQSLISFPLLPIEFSTRLPDPNSNQPSQQSPPNWLMTASLPCP